MSYFFIHLIIHYTTDVSGPHLYETMLGKIAVEDCYIITKPIMKKTCNEGGKSAFAYSAFLGGEGYKLGLFFVVHLYICF